MRAVLPSRRPAHNGAPSRTTATVPQLRDLVEAAGQDRDPQVDHVPRMQRLLAFARLGAADLPAVLQVLRAAAAGEQQLRVDRCSALELFLAQHAHAHVDLVRQVFLDEGSPITGSVLAQIGAEAALQTAFEGLRLRSRDVRLRAGEALHALVEGGLRLSPAQLADVRAAAAWCEEESIVYPLRAVLRAHGDEAPDLHLAGVFHPIGGVGDVFSGQQCPTCGWHLRTASAGVCPVCDRGIAAERVPARPRRRQPHAKKGAPLA